MAHHCPQGTEGNGQSLVQAASKFTEISCFLAEGALFLQSTIFYQLGPPAGWISESYLSVTPTLLLLLLVLLLLLLLLLLVVVVLLLLLLLMMLLLLLLSTAPPPLPVCTGGGGTPAGKTQNKKRNSVPN
jgi:hypothetical protein